MKKLTAFIVLFSTAALTASAQKRQAYYAANEHFTHWAEHPQLSPVAPEYARESAIYLVHDVDVNYKYEGRDTAVFYTEHNIVKVLDERGMEMYNTLRIPLMPGTKASIQARTIDPTGKVHEVDKSMIKQTKDETGRFMMSVAMEGVEKNSEIEYVLKTISPYTAYHQLYYQFSVPIALARFELSYPKELMFDLKSHNGFPHLRDTMVGGRKRIATALYNIPAAETEPNSFNNLHRMAIEYRVLGGRTGAAGATGAYNDIARHTFSTFYKTTDRERKAVNKFLSELGVQPNGNDNDNIKKIEQGIKNQITLYDVVDYDQRQDVRAYRSIKSMSRDDASYNEQNDVLDTIISKRSATTYGYVKLFAACLTQAGVSNELGLAGDRSEHRFDENFESAIGLSSYVFYFPYEKKFLDPENVYVRYPVVGSGLVGGKGVFCTIPLRGDVTGSLYAIRTVTPLPVRETGERESASVSFSKDMDPTVEVAYSWSGYLPTLIREKLPFVPKDKLKELVTGWVPFADKPEDIEKYTISNEGFDNNRNKPLELYALVHPSRLVSKTNREYIFRLGAIVGEQFNLYAEDVRKTAVDLQYPYYEARTITVNIPKGYHVTNAETIRMSADYLDDRMDQVISFATDYKLVKDKVKGDRLIVTVNEHYNQLHFAVNDYERYRKVVNTAADFNKVTLLMARNNVVAHPAKKKPAAPAAAATPAPVATNTHPAGAVPGIIKVGPARK